MDTLDTLAFDVLDFVKRLDNDQRLQVAIFADRISEALTETRNERGAV